MEFTLIVTVKTELTLANLKRTLHNNVLDWADYWHTLSGVPVEVMIADAEPCGESANTELTDALGRVFDINSCAEMANALTFIENETDSDTIHVIAQTALANVKTQP